MRRGDASFGPWQSAGNMLMTRSRSSAVIAGQYLYVIGGNGIDSSQFLGSIERSRIKSDGTLDTWELAGALSSPRAGHASVLVGQYLYVLGGETTLFGMQSNLVERAVIKPDGSLSTWETMPAMLAPRADFAAIVVNNYLYVIGGYNTGNQNFTQVEAAKINADGTVDSWTLASSTLSPKYSAVSEGNVIYAIGNDNTIERSESKDDGTLSFWNIVSLMPGNKSSTSALLADGYLYAIGAFYPCIYSSNQVIRAKINPDKSLGSWIPTASMQFGRSRFALAGTSTHMYVMGGWSGWHGATNSVEFTSHRDLKYRLYMSLFAR
jgi:hypothetical protein